MENSFQPKTSGQRRYIQAIDSNTVVFTIGPGGTGKSFVAIAKAVESLTKGNVSRIVLCRPAVEAGEKLGYMPGSFEQKISPYLRPIYDALEKVMDPMELRKLYSRDLIQSEALGLLRGRTLDNAFIIMDEAQNTTKEQMKMFLTRMGHGSKMIINGDLTQSDLGSDVESGLIHAQKIIQDIPGIKWVELNKDDIVRHPLVAKIVEKYELENKNDRIQ